MKVLHRHHIIPKHAGGTDAIDNIELLTVEQHAEAHRILFCKYGREEDRIAWLGLAGIIGKEDIVREAQRLGGKNASGKNNPWRKCRTRMNWAENHVHQQKAQSAAQSPAARQKKKEYI